LIEENVALKKNLDILKSESQMKTVELSRVVEENRMLNSKLELTSETLNNKLELLDQLNEEFYELEYEYQEMTFQNDELRKELNALRDITATKCKDDREYSDLKKALGYLKSQNQQISQAYQAAVLSARNANDLARAREDANEILQSTVADLKTKLSTWQYEYDVLKEDEVFYRDTAWNSDKTIFQLGEEITGLKEELKSQEKSFSYRMLELGRVKDEFLNSSLDSVNESLAAKLTEKSTDDEQIRTTLLDLKNYEFEKEKTELRQHIEFLEKENQQMWKTRESAVTSAEKAEKLALEQVAALSEALTELQAAVTHAKDIPAPAAAEADRDSNPNETKKDRKLKKWLKRHGVTIQHPMQEIELIKLIRITGLSMLEKSKHLQEHAEKFKVIGKCLKKKAKKLTQKNHPENHPDALFFPRFISGVFV
jgi:predicted  nucleic acid-binding Zn-ribbon protein